MDCNTARLLLFLSRPNTVDSGFEQIEALQRHLSRCAECEALAQAERAVENRIAKAMLDVPVPVDLRARIIGRVGAERHLRWQRVIQRHPRTATGIAAAILLVLGLGLYDVMRSRPVPKPGAILEASLAQRSALPGTIESWFRQTHGIQTVPPPHFNYLFLDSYDLVVDPTGERVPQLVFVRGTDRARVRILTNRQFDLKRTMDQAPADSGGLKVEIRPHPWRSDVAYLIVYNSDSLDWLVNEAPAAT